MAETVVRRPGGSVSASKIEEIEILWLTAGLGCDGDTIAMTGATQPSIEDIVTGALPWIPKVNFYNPFLAVSEVQLPNLEAKNRAWSDLLVVHDCHPQYASTAYALDLPAARKQSVQHHRAYIASVLAEVGECEKRVVGASFDGTGYGDDGSFWGGEIFVGISRPVSTAWLTCARRPFRAAILRRRIRCRLLRDSLHRSTICLT